MKAVVQRVKKASVKVASRVISEIGPGLVTLLGIEEGDSEESLHKMIQKVLNLRIFEDDEGKMNRSLKEIQGQHLIVSQFTLLGDCRKGNRPSFVAAEGAARANHLYEKALVLSSEQGIQTKGGQFQAHMSVSLVNDGPVTLILEF